MALYTDGLGKYQSEYDALWQRFVPKSGAAETLQGELVRLIGRLASEFYHNGNTNWTTNAGYFKMATCLQTELSRCFEDEQDKDAIAMTMSQIIAQGRTGIQDYLEGEDQYDKMTNYVVQFCQAHPQPISHDCPNTYQYSF